MKKSDIGCYGDSENLACVLEYLGPQRILRQPPISN
jgi:hypothetical protein